VRQPLARNEEDMEIADLKKQIKSGEFGKIYIFHGEEHAVMKIYLNMMAEKGGYEITYVDSLMDLMTGTKTKALVKSAHLYVIVDDKEFQTTEKMWDKFKGLKDDIVVFYYTTTDKRLKFWKHFKDRAVEFGKLNDDILMKYIEKEIGAQNEAVMKDLIDACQSDYGRILLELDKVKQYSRATGVIENGVLENFLQDGTIYRPPYDAIFDFVAAFLERRPAKAYDLLQQSKALGEPSLVIISNLYNNIKTLLQIQSAKDYKKLGLNGFAIKNVIRYKNNYTNGELVRALKLLREIEKGIKTGTMPDDLSVEYFMVQVI